MLNILHSNRIDTCKRLIKHNELWVYRQTTGYLTTPAFTSRKSVTEILTHFLQAKLTYKALHLVNTFLL